MMYHQGHPSFPIVRKVYPLIVIHTIAHQQNIKTIIDKDNNNKQHAASIDHTADRFNKLMDDGEDDIDEADREDDDDDDDEEDEGYSDEEVPSSDNNNNDNEMIGDYKRRRGSLDNGSDDQSFRSGLGEPIIVPLKTCSDDEDGPLVKDSPKKPHGRRLSRTKMEALSRNMVRRQSSNEMLAAMQQAAKDAVTSSLPTTTTTTTNDDDDDNHNNEIPNTTS